jgi:serine/threonine-protein phosphatase 5
MDSTNAVYFANRSLAYLRQESFGYALNDAVSSLKADPTYLKAYYRRAGNINKFDIQQL